MRCDLWHDPPVAHRCASDPTVVRPGIGRNTPLRPKRSRTSREGRLRVEGDDVVDDVLVGEVAAVILRDLEFAEKRLRAGGR